MEKYRKKPVVIEAVKWTGANVETICAFMCEEDCRFENGELIIHTLEDGKNGQAKHVADPGDWIIKGVHGEFYPCKPEIFEKTYEKVV